MILVRQLTNASIRTLASSRLLHGRYLNRSFNSKLENNSQESNSLLSLSFLRAYRKWVVKIGIGAPVTVGGMAALSHPCERGIYTSMYCKCRRRAYRDTSCKIKGRRVTGETMTINLLSR